MDIDSSHTKGKDHAPDYLVVTCTLRLFLAAGAL
jgi:hypothetical protein